MADDPAEAASRIAAAASKALADAAVQAANDPTAAADAEDDDDVAGSGDDGGGGADSGDEHGVTGEAPTYGSNEYWDKRYTKDPNQFDWYQSFDGMRYFFTPYINAQSRVLMIGCGTSDLTEDMYAYGWPHIVNIDISAVAIDVMGKKHADKPLLKWYVADVMDLRTGAGAGPDHPQVFADNTFDAVIDKGTLDALLCGKDGDRNARLALSEMARVLKPDGALLYITYGAPPSRVHYMTARNLPLTLQQPVITIPQKHGDECTCGGCEEGKNNKRVQPQPGSFKPATDSKFAEALSGKTAADGKTAPVTASARRIAEAAQWNDEDFHFLYTAIKNKPTAAAAAPATTTAVTAAAPAAASTAAATVATAAAALAGASATSAAAANGDSKSSATK